MFSKKNNKGFTLMEMLIVVAIIAILIAIMIPTFNSQLEKAREAADAANIRSAYAEALVKYISGDGAETDGTYVVETQKMTQTDKGFDIDMPEYLKDAATASNACLFDSTAKDDIYVITVGTDGAVTITLKA